MTTSRGRREESIGSGTGGDQGGGSAGSGTVRKPCVFCGVECDGQPRVKDPQGRYYCKPCYDTRDARRAERPAPSESGRSQSGRGDGQSGADEDPVIDLAGLASAASAVPTAAAAALVCPACASSLAPGAVFCVGCGHDLRTGAKASTKVQKAPKATGKPGSAPRGASSLSGPLVGWTLGLGGSIPLVIAVVTALADGIERIYSQRAMAEEFGNAGFRAPPTGGPMLVGMAIGSIIGGLLYYFIASWWFQKRVAWAGGSVDTDTARSSYFASLLPYTVISVIAAVLLISGDGGGAAGDIAATLAIIGFGTLFATCIWLFWIAKEAFGVRTVPGVILLVVLPWVMYGVIFAAVLVGTAATAAAAGSLNAGLPSNQSAQSARGGQQVLFPGSAVAPIQISHPEGWTLEEMPRDEGDPQWGISIDGPDGASLAVYASTEPILFNDWVRDMTGEFRRAGLTLVPTGSIATLGPFAGQGTEFGVRSADGRARARLFVAEVPDRGWVMIQTFMPDPDAANNAAVIQRMANSIVIKW